MCELAGETVSGGLLSIALGIDGGLDVTVTADVAFSANQLSACSGSAQNGSTTTCENNGTLFTGVCSKLCCTSSGSSAKLSGCTASAAP